MRGTATVPELTHESRDGFVETMKGLGLEQWDAPSLCTEWRVVDVAAHLAWAPVLGASAGALALARNRLSMNRMIARLAVAWADRGHDAILSQLRDNARSDAIPIGMPPVAALADAIVHGLDVRRPLGLARQVPLEAFAPVAAFALRTPWPLTAVVGGSARRRVAGVRLVASDADWAHGSGPEVLASAETLLLLLYGRPVSPDELAGEGSALLSARLR